MNAEPEIGISTFDDPACPQCDRCGEPMRSVHCKLICPNCGYTRDCSDP